MTRRRKPAGWPKLMVAKRLKGGAVGYYGDVPRWGEKKGGPLESEALGADYAIAKQRCDEVFNPQFDSWRVSSSPELVRPDRPLVGTFDWLVATYKALPKYTRRPIKTRVLYDRALRLVSQYR